MSISNFPFRFLFIAGQTQNFGFGFQEYFSNLKKTLIKRKSHGNYAMLSY